ncbi:AAA family ATPase [Aeromonas salmonicida subsp. achromogenes]|uniref:AAA family ATPase n=1 Tax=Aeromonas salmonicida TaxID=645 RepID=UPI0002D9026F|nr:AAA family ATPase [Aeromonas salmonicida]TMX09884.1 AAA family ATPase [Aeromonas salmonicida subsp. achromogenes]TMX12299.1 AAA family ATPase [Aeromonas salmonicida subsp. achromogenes]TMX12961.1 AAA family ATPase [Aeromonas salmonicida subsp. achromogenes]TMX19323.1 AAA family ATPase [Aeromonas salmonicida subsp. achromogenes]
MKKAESHRVVAVYQTAKLSAYQGNPLIEALPPLNSFLNDSSALKGSLRCTVEDIHLNGVERAHCICRVIDDFFQPLSQHIQLHERLSLMIRGGYVGRNPETGDWAKHIQNGYERVISGDLKAIKFTDVNSTAQSMTLIGCSGNGKTTAMKQLLSLYPQVIYHPDRNFEQVVYLKIDCSHDGSLKELCMNFFRAMDRALGTSNYQKQYSTSKRPSIETLLAAMAQVANSHALGVLIIDEIQHLSRSRSGGSEKMLNFFVTLVNTIGLPVILVGTPRAREIFEADMRSARRGSGLGAIFWDPMEEGREWKALTDKLWTLQWLQKRDEVLSDEIRALWYDLSQGVLDIVIKLFVLCQLRAIATKVERITPKLMQQVYEDELKPVHPMLAALRSGDAEEMIKFSDLKLSDTDKRLLELRQRVAESAQQTPEEFAYQQLRTDEERRVYMALKDEFDSTLLAPVIRQLFDQNPELTWIGLLPMIHEQLTKPAKLQLKEEAKASKGARSSSIKQAQWHTLGSDDLRFIHSQSESDTEMYSAMSKTGLVLNIQSLLEKAG